MSGLLILGAGGGSLIILSVLLLRRKKPYGAISHGVVEVRDIKIWGGVPEPGHGGTVISVVRSLCPTIPPLFLLQVDPMLTLEEQQLRELQHHGYENPTYHFLEERP